MKKDLPKASERYIFKRAAQFIVGPLIIGVGGNLINGSGKAALKGANWVQSIKDFCPPMTEIYSFVDAAAYDFAIGGIGAGMALGIYLYNQIADQQGTGFQASLAGARNASEKRTEKKETKKEITGLEDKIKELTKQIAILKEK